MRELAKEINNQSFEAQPRRVTQQPATQNHQMGSPAKVKKPQSPLDQSARKAAPNKQFFSTEVLHMQQNQQNSAFPTQRPLNVSQSQSALEQGPKGLKNPSMKIMVSKQLYK